MKICALQMNCQADKSLNLKQAESLIHMAVENAHPDLIVLPEMFTYLGESAQERQAAAEILPTDSTPEGDAYQMLSKLAKKHNVMIHGGSLCEQTADAFYNTSILFDRNGLEIGRYRKMHLLTLEINPDTRVCESDFYSAGRQISSCPVKHNNHTYQVGMSICFDLRFPMLYQQLSQLGCELIIVPAAFFYETGKDHWETLLRARAIETQSYLVASAQTGQVQLNSHFRRYWGHSMIVNPWGNIIAEAGTEVGYITAEIDLEYLQQIRSKLPLQKYRPLITDTNVPEKD